jgi:hypothetical protein
MRTGRSDRSGGRSHWLARLERAFDQELRTDAPYPAGWRLHGAARGSRPACYLIYSGKRTHAY